MNKIKCKILLWIFFIICSAISIFFANKYSKKMMPSIKLEISMNRQQALTKAKILAKKFKLTPLNGKAIAYFCNNDELQSFIELECGGKKTYSNLLKNKMKKMFRRDFFANFLFSQCVCFCISLFGCDTLRHHHL